MAPVHMNTRHWLSPPEAPSCGLNSERGDVLSYSQIPRARPTQHGCDGVCPQCVPTADSPDVLPLSTKHTK